MYFFMSKIIARIEMSKEHILIYVRGIPFYDSILLVIFFFSRERIFFFIWDSFQWYYLYLMFLSSYVVFKSICIDDWIFVIILLFRGIISHSCLIN
jgi:hypothetical protein